MEMSLMNFTKDVISHIKAEYVVKLNSNLESVIIVEKKGILFVNNKETDEKIESIIERLYNEGFNEFISY